MSHDDLIITSVENRGTDEVPFGFVYFNDERRVAYAVIDDEVVFVGQDLSLGHLMLAAGRLAGS